MEGAGAVPKVVLGALFARRSVARPVGVLAAVPEACLEAVQVALLAGHFAADSQEGFEGEAVALVVCLEGKWAALLEEHLLDDSEV